MHLVYPKINKTKENEYNYRDVVLKKNFFFEEINAFILQGYIKSDRKYLQIFILNVVYQGIFKNEMYYSFYKNMK